jgi:uncharacterized protein (TIGR02231 family)
MRLLIALALLPALACPAQAAEIKASSRIDAVTVYPSGAEIVRLAKVRLERGDHVLVLADLPARAIHNSIRVEAKGTAKLEITSVDSRRLLLPRTDDAIAASERRRIEDAIEKLRDDKGSVQAMVDAAEAQKTLIGNLAQLPTHAPPANAAAPPQPDWSALFGIIGERFAEAQRAALEAKIKMRGLERQIKDLEGKLASLAPAQEERTEVKIFASAAAPLETDILVRYQVKGASWVPYYDARLQTGTKAQPPTLQLVRRASIQQRSGEAWEEVALSLSTARPGADTSAPELNTVTIDYEPDLVPQRPAVVSNAQRSIAREAAAPAGLAGSQDEERRAAEAPPKQQAEEQQAMVEAQAFQAVYSIAGRVSVPATGEAKRVRIDDMPIDPALMVRSVPKRDQKAYLYAKITVARGTPILPGQVLLFRDAIFVGNGRLPLLAPGEEHELGFGVDDSVRVRHSVLEEKRSESGILTSSKTDSRNYRITVKNLHERAVPVTVIDQIPVSQNADIKIELVAKAQPTKRDLDDKRGLLAWELKVEPDEEKAIEFGYRVTWPAARKIIYAN